MTKNNFAFLDVLTRIAELKIEQLFNVIGIIVKLSRKVIFQGMLNIFGNFLKMTGQKKILVVDDDRVCVRLIRGYLKDIGCEILVATDGFEALNSAKTIIPDLIILDVMLPEINGFHVCRLLKFDERYKTIPIIVLTARDHAEDEKISDEVFADCYMKKPISRKEFLQEVKRLLRFN